MRETRRPVRFLGDSLKQLRDFPDGARKQAGVELHRLQLGLEPLDWKPMSSVGMGVREIRIRDDGGAFRVIYIVRTAEAVYILHAFQKKTQQTAKHDLDLVATGLGGEPPQADLSLWEGLTMERQVDVEEFANVWDALTDTPEESANMTMRADLLIALQQKIAGWGLTQVEAAKKLGVTQPRLSDLLRGRIEKFSLDMLINLALQAGLSVRLEIAA